ncbi:hypothetical protein DPC56_07280 [Methanothermobacter tenebrarum]|uniref:Uncharacterized protein n=1 Tax=Methanothermobacter tenebrarum TaxID=680118 RepID=A0A328PDZ0_9EURY|nr:hypothetical protein DPC56_07280 [Methanothermobacter tenebrarum]
MFAKILNFTHFRKEQEYKGMERINDMTSRGCNTQSKKQVLEPSYSFTMSLIFFHLLHLFNQRSPRRSPMEKCSSHKKIKENVFP